MVKYMADKCVSDGGTLTCVVCVSTKGRPSEAGLRGLHGDPGPELPAGARGSQQPTVLQLGRSGQPTGEISHSPRASWEFSIPVNDITSASSVSLCWPDDVGLMSRDLCLFQLKLIYSKNSVLTRYFQGSSVQAFRYELLRSHFTHVLTLHLKPPELCFAARETVAATAWWRITSLSSTSPSPSRGRWTKPSSPWTQEVSRADRDAFWWNPSTLWGSAASSHEVKVHIRHTTPCL